MRKRLFYWFAAVLLAICVVAVVWLGSFRIFDATNPSQTFLIWAISVLTFVLMVTLGWILFRTLVKLYIERQSNRAGSRIRTKLVLGALALTSAPVFCLVLWSYSVLNYNVRIWFTQPVKDEVEMFVQVAQMLRFSLQDRITAQAGLLAAQPEIRALLDGNPAPGFLEHYCRSRGLQSAAVFSMGNRRPVDSWGPYAAPVNYQQQLTSDYFVVDGGQVLGSVVVTAAMPVDVQKKQAEIGQAVHEFHQLSQNRNQIKLYYILLEALLTLFVLFVATWIALFLAKQISVPITAILEGAGQVRQGNLKHRVTVRAVDELALLVRGFNQMTEALETSSAEIDRRRRFTEAILESIPSGVLSIGADGSIQTVNPALLKIFPAEQVSRATRLEDLFSREDTAEIKYLMKRARRTGVAARQIELRIEGRNLHLSVTVAALEERLTSGFVMVFEDTSELLRAQKAAAWHEVARRVAHEIKNPLTPIALSAERIERQIARLEMPPSTTGIIRECTETISKSVDSVKTLVDEFSRFARFPAAQLVRTDLNDVVRGALAVFKGRLDGISIQTSLAAGLPAVNLDPEQFQRAVVNLVDNGAEAMQDSLVKNLYVATQPGTAETVELVVADSGCGVSPEDKEKLFLPYFSTKNRGTGLGLAIVSHIVSDHHGQIRVEDNKPAGARFTIEIPVPLDPDAETASESLAAGGGTIMKQKRVLVVDDEPEIRKSLSGVLEDEGYAVDAVPTGEACLEVLPGGGYELVLLDIWLPGMDGMEALARIQEIAFEDRPVVVMISGHGSIEAAVKATKLGAFDFLEKPLSLQKIMVVVKNGLEHRSMALEMSRLKGSDDNRWRILGESVPMKALRQQLGLMAGSNGRVLIYGESGTGKELIAHALHSLSPRAAEPFVEVNCAAIPEDLIESELFGHRKGSFPGAQEAKAGKFQKADGGTLFLDEVGDMSLRTQSKVLRVIEEQRIEPLGASESMQVDVRVVAATNKNLEEEIARGNFREDLFYRLNVIPFFVPPLRDRREDIPQLAFHFLREFTTAYGRKPKELTPEALHVLADHHWPGNVRELRNLIERIVILNPQVRVDARHIPLNTARRPPDRPLDRFGSLQEVREAAEREYILKKLEETHGNVTRTAELLGLERSNLYRKMKALGIGPGE